jgi:hypothetical protein
MTFPACAGFLGVVAISATLISGPVRAQVPQTDRDADALQQWTLGLEGYLVLREQALQTLPPRRLADARELLERSRALASAIRARRADAQPGELFTMDVRRTFRKLIAHALTDHQIAVNDLMASLRAEALPGEFRLAINQLFPWQLGAAMPPCVLDALPALPDALQFRLVGRDLILIDLDANLVIDVLPEALPRAATGSR